jgi:hypothetical protein
MRNDPVDQALAGYFVMLGFFIVAGFVLVGVCAWMLLA